MLLSRPSSLTNSPHLELSHLTQPKAMKPASPKPNLTFLDISKNSLYYISLIVPVVKMYSSSSFKVSLVFDPHTFLLKLLPPYPTFLPLNFFPGNHS